MTTFKYLENNLEDGFYRLYTIQKTEHNENVVEIAIINEVPLDTDELEGGFVVEELETVNNLY